MMSTLNDLSTVYFGKDVKVYVTKVEKENDSDVFFSLVKTSRIHFDDHSRDDFLQIKSIYLSPTSNIEAKEHLNLKRRGGNYTTTITTPYTIMLLISMISLIIGIKIFKKKNTH